MFPVHLPADDLGNLVPLLRGRFQTDGSARCDATVMVNEQNPGRFLIEKHAVELVFEHQDVVSGCFEILFVIQFQNTLSADGTDLKNQDKNNVPNPA